MSAAREQEVETVLLAGATGRLGSRTAYHLLRQPATDLRVLVRPGTVSDPAKLEFLRELRGRGAVLTEASLEDAAALEAATESVDTVISTLQGGHDVMVKGQLALAEAAARRGAHRILPSDFNLDLFRAVPGEHAEFDLRREADELIALTGLTHVHMLPGVFMDTLLDHPGGYFDHTARSASYWGTGTERVDATSVDTTAQLTAAVARDPDVGSGKFAFAAQQLSFNEMVNSVEDVTGHRYRRHRLGSVDDLRARVRARLAAGWAPRDLVRDVHALYMLSGQTALRDLQNHPYPQVPLEQVDTVVRRRLAPSATG